MELAVAHTSKSCMKALSYHPSIMMTMVTAVAEVEEAVVVAVATQITILAVEKVKGRTITTAISTQSSIASRPCRSLTIGNMKHQRDLLARMVVSSLA